ncbi:MAG: hypothetical protein J0I99_00280 [Devosia sp.]|uniref:hypothetical protein n=1 Tax=Devosia sp. TaxID=1871048 RepID=UPI001ACA0BF8|nr:hypothetical protein [Devosia sp.]MBN9314154.1 hypothetical protein [Devosia sp.]
MAARSICLVAIASTVVFTIGESHAARMKFRVGSGLASVGRSIKTYPSTTLSPARLKDCVERENNIGKIEDSRTLIHAEIERKQDELKKEKSQLEYIAIIIDERKAASVREFNKKVDLFNSKREKLNEAMSVFNAGSVSFKREVDKFNEECAGKLYYKDDLIAARQELGLPVHD